MIGQAAAEVALNVTLYVSVYDRTNARAFQVVLGHSLDEECP
jgi:hypothetical protein